MSIDPEFVELTADVLRILLSNTNNNSGQQKILAPPSLSFVKMIAADYFQVCYASQKIWK